MVYGSFGNKLGPGEKVALRAIRDVGMIMVGMALWSGLAHSIHIKMVLRRLHNYNFPLVDESSSLK